MEISASEGSADAGNPEGANAPGAEGVSTGGGDFLSALSEDNRKTAEAKGWTSTDNLNGVFDAYRGLEGKMGNALSIPGKDATPEDRAAFYDKAAATWAPKEGKGYEFKLPDGLPEDFAYDKDFAKEASDWFKGVKLSPEAAQSLHDNWVSKMAGMHKSAQEAAAKAEAERVENAATAHRQLVNEIGQPDSDGYRNFVAKASRAADGLGLTEWMAEKGVLGEADANGNRPVMDPHFVKVLAKVADGMFLEDGMQQAGLAEGENPFAKGAIDPDKASKITRENPDLAKRLITAAGRDPKAFGLS